MVYLYHQWDVGSNEKGTYEKNGGGEESIRQTQRHCAGGAGAVTRYGYRKTSIDEIAAAAQVAKRTVYLHFENKAAVFVAMLEYLGEQVRVRCVAAEKENGTAAQRFAGLLEAYFGMAFELFCKSEHMPELEEAFSKLARERVAELNAEYEARLAKFLRSLVKTGEVGGPPPGLTVEQIVWIVMRSTEASKHDPAVRGDWKAFQTRVREIATLAIAAMKK